MDLSEELKKQAVARGLCTRWTQEWADATDPQGLIDKYKRGIDFVLKQGEWPSNDFIKENFDADLLADNLIFVDANLDIDHASNGIYILNGKCTGTIHFHDWAAATIYVRHTSDIRVVASDFAKVFVHVHDDAAIETDTSHAAAIKVYRHLADA